MADTINLSDVSTKDDSKLKTGGRRSYKMAIHKGKCPSGEHLVKGKCIPRKKVESAKADTSKYSKKKKGETLLEWKMKEMEKIARPKVPKKKLPTA